MKAKLEFDLPEEREDFDHAIQGAAMWCFIDNLFTWMQRYDKHEDPGPLTIEQVRDKVDEIMADTGGLEELFR